MRFFNIVSNIEYLDSFFKVRSVQNVRHVEEWIF